MGTGTSAEIGAGAVRVMGIEGVDVDRTANGDGAGPSN